MTTRTGDKGSRQKQQMRGLFDEVAEVYPAAGFFSLFGRSLVSWSGLPRGGSVLDLAAGRGAVLDHLLSKSEPTSAVAVDLSTQMVMHLRESSARAERARLGFATMDAEALGFASHSFDAVLSGFAFNMIPRPDLAIREVYRVLRPGGIFAASIPAPALSNPFPAYSALTARYGQLLDPRRWTISELPEPGLLLTRAGFLDVAKVHDEVAIEVTDPAEFWEMEMAHGLRGFYQALPEAVQHDFYTEVHEVLRPPRGGVRLVGRGAYFLRGRKPSAVRESK